METLGIILAVVIATTVGFYFECDAARRFNVLTAMNEDQRVKVRRNGRVTEVKRREVVVGDIILVEVGDEIPADAQLVEAVNLQVDESSLTGEPLTTKSIDATKEGNEAHDEQHAAKTGECVGVVGEIGWQLLIAAEDAVIAHASHTVGVPHAVCAQVDE